MTSSDNSFFTPDQIRALSTPPDPDRLRQIRGVPYITGNEVIQRLNQIIGPGYWSLTTEHIDTQIREVTRTGRTNEPQTLVQATVFLEVTLTIFARDNSGRTLQFREPGVGDGECDRHQNLSVALEKAASTAATNGLKRCARLLGPALGLGLSGGLAMTSPPAASRRPEPARPMPAPLPPPATRLPDAPADPQTPVAQSARTTTSRPAEPTLPRTSAGPHDLTNWDINRPPATAEEERLFARALREQLVAAATTRRVESLLRQTATTLETLPESYRNFLIKTANDRLAALGAPRHAESTLASASNQL